MQEQEIVEWVLEPPSSNGMQQQPAADGLSYQQRIAGRQWKEQWQALLKREAQAAADVAACMQGGVLNSKELRLQDTAQEQGVVAHTAIPQLRNRAWTEVAQIQAAVTAVKSLLSDVQTGPAYIDSLARSVERVDQLLSSFHAWNQPAMASLDKQAQQLEQEVESLALRIEDDMLSMDANRDAHSQHCTTARRSSLSGGHQQTHKTLARGVSAPTQRDQNCATNARKTAGKAGSIDVTINKPAIVKPRPASAQQPSVRSVPPTTSTIKGQSQGRLAPEVVAFDDFIEEHGPYGGWQREDNEEFESILKSCNGDYHQAVNLAVDRCVGFTKSDIIQHARWHMDYMDLLVKKRMAVAAWRVRRDQVRSKQQAQHALLVPDPSQAPAAQAAAEAATAATAAAETVHEAAVKKELVQSWKRRRADALRQDGNQLPFVATTAAAEHRTQAESERAMREQIEWEERQSFNKMKLDVYKQYKDQQREQAAQRAKEEAEKERALQSLNSNQVAAIAHRNADNLARKHQLIARKSADMQKRAELQQQLLANVHMTVPSDPQRVLKGTAAHMKRVEQKREEQLQPRDSAFILHQPQRQPASWRAGVAGIW